MQILKRAVIVVVALWFVAGAIPALAQEQNVIQGQLVRVDTTAQSIVVRTETGSQMQFSYTDETKITGADETVAGLGTLTGSPVTVLYDKQETKLVARQIDVQKKT